MPLARPALSLSPPLSCDSADTVEFPTHEYERRGRAGVVRHILRDDEARDVKKASLRRRWEDVEGKRVDVENKRLENRPGFDNSAQLPKFCGNEKTYSGMKRNLWEMTVSVNHKLVASPTSNLRDPSYDRQMQAANPQHRAGSPLQKHGRNARAKSSWAKAASAITAVKAFQTAAMASAPAPEASVLPRKLTTASPPLSLSAGKRKHWPLLLVLQLALLTLAFWESAYEFPAAYRSALGGGDAWFGLLEQRGRSGVRLSAHAIAAAKVIPHVAALVAFRFPLGRVPRLLYVAYACAFAAHHHVHVRGLFASDGGLDPPGAAAVLLCVASGLAAAAACV